MSKNAHTPGPWSLSGPYHPHGSAFPVLYVDGTVHGAVASVHLHHEWGGANARLISAAPDMLAALDSLLKTFVDDLSECGYDEDDINDHDGVKRARAAISKAKGEA